MIMEKEKMIIYDDILGYFDKLIDQIGKLEEVDVKTRYGHKIHKAEIHLLVQINNTPGKSMSELARTLDVTRGMISQLAKKLEEKELIEKKKSLANERDVLLYNTAEGERIVKLHAKFYQDLNDVFLDYFSKLDYKQTDTILEFLKVTETFIDQTIKEQTENEPLE
ncbi:MAG TPA: MarR family winged helix-turn-helix transcriptional regulator [Candidatus Dorea intestinavium]|nr:MarR family winged helix-turn-helix transcriptional regulator [Candidatus Dorea intestinavium]